MEAYRIAFVQFAVFAGCGPDVVASLSLRSGRPKDGKECTMFEKLG